MSKVTYKVLQITPWFPPDKGGIATHVLALSENLVQMGFDISVIAPRNVLNENKQREQDLMKVTRIPSVFFPGWPYPTLRSVSIPLDLRSRIRSLIKDGNYDLVHVHDLHYPLTWVAIFFSNRYNVPTVLTVHGIYSLNPNVLGGKTTIEELMNKYLFSRMISKTAAVIGLTQGITQAAHHYGSNCPYFYTVANGVRTEVYRNNLAQKGKYRKKYGLGEDSIVILFVGRLEHVKGILDFAYAAKEFVNLVDKTIEVVIVGSGSLEVQVDSILGGISKVHRIRWHPNELIHEIYIASDIFVIPSKFEGLPVTLLEAMNANLHIIYSPVGGIPEVLQGYSMKTVINEVSAHEILKVVTHLVSSSDLSGDEKSLAYAQNFDWKNIAKQTAKIYNDILKS